MRYEDAFELVKRLPFDAEKTICKMGTTELFIIRPSNPPKRFKDYDVKKNFQIWLREEKREFKPNHLRVMIDLNLRVRSRPDLKKQLLEVFDNIYYHKDPDVEIRALEREKFEHFLNPLRIIANLTQFFIIEQDYCYHKESQFDPPTLFLQGWVREFIDSPKEIDNLCMSVCNRQPPKATYTTEENKKNKRYLKDRTPLWYLDKKNFGGPRD